MGDFYDDPARVEEDSDRGHSDISRFSDTLLRKYAPAGSVPSRVTKATRSSVNGLPAKNIARLPVTPAFNRSSFHGGSHAEEAVLSIPPVV